MLKLSGLENLNKALKRYANATGKAPVIVAKEIGLEIYRQTVLTTPVDTGRLVGAWQISEGSQASFVTNPYDDGISRKQSEQSIKQSAIDKSITAINAVKGGSIIWVANNVDYAPFQEAKKLMLSAAVEYARNRADKLAKEVF